MKKKDEKKIEEATKSVGFVLLKLQTIDIRNKYFFSLLSRLFSLIAFSHSKKSNQKFL